MTLQEAMESGKDFRRKGWSNENWFMFVDMGGFKAYGDDGGYTRENARKHSILTCDILENDWEIKGPSFEISEVQLTRMFNELERNSNHTESLRSSQKYWRRVLGFKE